jgi:dihydropteroate synthase
MITVDPSKIKLMGVINVTPDSFSDGGRFIDREDAIEQALLLIEQGADILDIGGESSRPNARPVPEEEEMERVIPVIEGIAKATKIPISIDTYKAEVAREAISVGASIVNDISALRFDKNMAAVVAQSGCRIVLMHMLGNPKMMQKNPFYEDVVSDVSIFLKDRAEFAVGEGIAPENIWIDPGIGFGKRLEDNLDLLAKIDTLRRIGYKTVVGTSRKSFIGLINMEESPENRLFGSLGSFAWAALAGVDILRVHDVRETRRMLEVIAAIASREEKIDGGDR